MEEFVLNQIKYGLKYVPVNLAKSFFIKKSSDETKAIREKGFICGVCHHRGDKQKLIDANIEWIRADIPFPFEKDGTVRKVFTDFKNSCAEYSKAGIKIMAITPYPQDYLSYGIELNTPQGEQKIKEIAVFIIEELKDCIGAVQVTNEMGIPRFTIPLTMDDAARFIAVQLEALYPVKGDILVGYNSAGPQADLHCKLKPYLKYCDYVGVDIYVGCFMNIIGFMWMFDAVLRFLWAFTGKPIVLQEFGYIGAGAPKSKAGKKEILRKYGVSSAKEAKKNIGAFVEAMPEYFANHVKYLAHNDESRYFNLLFKSDLTNHLYCELPAITKIPGCPHTPEGQAKFYSKILPRLYNMEFMAGAIIYCYADVDVCYVCGQKECPTETRWGIVDCDLNPKPAYYAVKEAYSKIRNK